MKINRKKRIGLALGSGGAKGLAHIAILQIFDKHQLTPAVISGTSFGALAGGLYAAGLSAKDIEIIFQGMNLFTMTKLLDIAWEKWNSLIRGKKIYDWIKTTLPCETFEQCRIPLKIITTDFWSHEQIILDSGPLVDAIRASISIPGIFKPYEYNRRIYIDGAVSNPVPFDIIREDCDLLIGIDTCGNMGEPARTDQPNVIECVFNSFELMCEKIERYKEAKSQPDIIVRFKLNEVQTLQFYQIDKVLSEIKPQIDKFEDDLLAALKK